MSDETPTSKPSRKQRKEYRQRTVPERIVLKEAVIRLLSQGYGTNKIAQMLSIEAQTVSNIKVGRIYYNQAFICLEHLGLMKSNGKLCRKCGEPYRYMTKSRICVQCEITELVKQKLLKLVNDKTE